jgi:hypothetical protein
MTTTKVLVTALPHSLADEAAYHLTAFVTHKLVPQTPDATLADFPAAADWVATLQAGRWELVTDAVGQALPLTVVPHPDAPTDADAWRACLPPSTPVAGFPAPQVSTAQWSTLPANRLSDHAVNLHLANLTAAPTGRPPVLSNPAFSGLIERLDRLAVSGDSNLIRRLRGLAEQRLTLPDRTLAQRLDDALVSLGQTRRGDNNPYQTTIADTRSAIEALVDDDRFDAVITRALDVALERATDADPETRLLLDAHATRRYYDRPEEQVAYQPTPTPGAQVPRPEVQVPDFHQRAGSFATTPVLLHRLGLAVRLQLADQDRALLAGATWVSVRFVPAGDADVVRFAPPRTLVSVEADSFAAISSDDWSRGALPLGDAGYVVLDLDPDASGLKIEQHVRNLPRAIASEANGDDATSAPGSLRSTGFAIARADRADAVRQQVSHAETLDAQEDGPGVVGPTVQYDDLVRGLRVEVWDDRSKAWHSLHERLVDVAADDFGAVLTATPDAGFLQLSALNRVPGGDTNPYYLHEVLAGWDGWSLGAPRPGKVIVSAADGSEQVLDEPPDDPVTGVHVTTRVRPGTLPRLRWGTSYAFRVLGVDLAGGLRPRPDDPAPNQAVTPQAVQAARAHLQRVGQVYQQRDEVSILTPVRGRLVADTAPVQTGPSSSLASVFTGFSSGIPVPEPSGVLPEVLPEVLRTGVPEIDEFLVDRIASATGSDGSTRESSASVAAERTQVGRAARFLASVAPSWRVRPQLQVTPEDLAPLLGPLPIGPFPPAPLPVVATTPRPYLRWAPVPPPTLVARSELTTGEQLGVLVVRTGTTNPPATSERHIVPAKGTQVDAETAGLFDAAIGSTDDAVQKAAYAIALAERGTLLDQQIPSLDDANGTRTQPGIALASRPGADPSTAVTLDEITAKRDTPLGEGQYVVHDVDDLVLPYLPDPHAAGVAFVFCDAGAPHLMSEPRALQSVVLPFPGDWPRLEPLRLVLTGGDALGAHLDGRVITVTVPAGEQVRVAMSSSLRPEDLQVFGLWRSQPASIVDPNAPGTTAEQIIAADLLARAAVRGWTWWLTPSTDLRFVHAVPAPVRVPNLLGLRCLPRVQGRTMAQLAGVADVHGASTDRLVVRAAWSEWVDDLAADGPQRVDRSLVVVDSPVGGHEHWGLLWLIDFQPFGASQVSTTLADGGIGLHRARATFPDTHRRTLTCTPSGTTRYAEYFTPAELPAADDASLSGSPAAVEVPSSERPAAPDIADTVPLLRWETQTEPDQPFALRRTRRSGARIWLRRPWFSSGDGELLAVVLSGTQQLPDGTVSLWGRDPVYTGASITDATKPPLVEPPQLLLQTAGGVVVPRAARPVTPAIPEDLVDVDGHPTAQILGYQPEFHPGRGLWFVDVAMDDVPALWPFVRLAVARYQESSIDGCALSPVTLTSWVQPLPARTCTVSRPDASTVRVTLTGTIAALRADQVSPASPDPDADTPTGQLAAFDALLAQSRTVDVHLQMLPQGGSDLQWTTVSSKRLHVTGIGTEADFHVTWAGDLALPDRHDVPFELRTPGSNEHWRVLIEENELLDADRPGVPNDKGLTSQLPRVVYADTIQL